MIAVDWQLIDRSVGPRDLAYLVTQSVERRRPRPATSRLFDTYLDDLAERGVDLDREVGVRDVPLRRDARLRVPGDRGGALTIDDPRHVELVRALFVRSIRALDELDAFDLPL